LAQASRRLQIFLTGLYFAEFGRKLSDFGCLWLDSPLQPDGHFREEKTHGLDETFVCSFYKYGKPTTKVLYRIFSKKKAI
jgi:hypothetical protein